LQDVPQWYQFEGSRTAQYLQLGNGIPVNLGRAVAAHLLRALGKPVPMPNALAARPLPKGLWPMDRVDACAAFTGVLGYPDSDAAWGPFEKPLTPQDRRRRPFPTRQEFDRMLRWREEIGARVAAVPPGATRERYEELEVGYWRPTPERGAGTEEYVHDPDWTPGAPDDYPPGFPDATYWFQWIDGEGEAYNHYARLYREGFPEHRYSWPHRPEYGYPAWSRFVDA
jgi:hypothetical protein